MQTEYRLQCSAEGTVHSIKPDLDVWESIVTQFEMNAVWMAQEHKREVLPTTETTYALTWDADNMDEFPKAYVWAPLSNLRVKMF